MINRSKEISQFKNAMRAALPPFKGRKVYPQTEWEKWVNMNLRCNYDYSGVSDEMLFEMSQLAEAECVGAVGNQYAYMVARTGLEAIRQEEGVRK